MRATKRSVATTAAPRTTMAEPGTLVGALELGGSKALCALGTSQHTLAEARVPTTTPDQTLAAIEAFFAPYRGQLGALGIASFGPLELSPGAPGFGAILATPKPGWAKTPLRARLASTLGVPVGIDTDVNAAALAEQRLGSARGDESCVYITVGTGVGVGVLLGGAPLHGLLHPELGHLAAPAWCDFAGVCPFHGRCIEGVASAHAISVRTGKPPASLADDDPLWALEARYLAALLAACVLAYAPRRIVLGGGVCERAGLVERVRAELVAQLAGYVPRAQLTAEGVGDYVRRPLHGTRAGLVGAFLLGEAALHDAR
jgi:fructokinase